MTRATRSDKWEVSSEEQLKQIESMAGIGLNYEQISAIFGISSRTFDRRIAENEGNNPLNVALRRGRAVAISNVAKAAYNMAIKEKQPTMTQFFLCCKGGWRDTTHIEMDANLDIKAKTTEMSDQEALEYVQNLSKK